MEPSLCRRTLSGMRGFCSCSQHLLRLTLDPSPSIVHLFRRWNPTMILTMVIISTMTIICIIRHKTYYDDYSYYNCFSLIIAIIAIILIICFRLAGICGLSSTIRARLQETCSLCHPHSKHSGKTCGCACWRHRNHSVPPAKRLSGRTRRPPAGSRRRMRDVVCQLVGIGMVPWYVMNGRGVDCATVRHEVWHGERFHVSTIIHHVWSLLPSDIHVQYHCHLDLPAVHR